MVQKVEAQLFFVSPMECKPVDIVPEGPEWQYEIKFDGYRGIVVKQANEIELYSRRGNVLNAQFPNVAEAIAKLRGKSFILDGEIVALDEQGRQSFSILQNARGSLPVHFYVFDLLHFEGRSLIGEPLRERRAQLESVFQGWPEYLHLSPQLKGSVKTLVEKIEEFEFEGLVAKRLDSIYEPGKRPGTWVKHKLQRSEEMVIGGYVPGRVYLDEILVGKMQDGRLVFAGSVRNGFVAATRRTVHDALQALKSEKCPFANLPEKKHGPGAMTREKMKGVQWVEPRVMCEIAFNEWTETGHLRHAKFCGLKETQKLLL